MTGESPNAAHQSFQTLLDHGAFGSLDDSELLERFAGTPGERSGKLAFETLVERHGPMVLGVCRRVLVDPNDAEDAFQATFLVLVRKARTIARRDLVAHWLYGVAYRTAREARTRTARRRSRLEPMTDIADTRSPGDCNSGDLRPILDAELSRLAERYRAVIVVCELEGKSRKEAARQLGLSEGTVSSRLSRGRSLLRARLARRGVMLSAGAIAAGLSRDAAAATVPTTLRIATVRAVVHYASGAATTGAVSASVATLTERVLKAMLVTKLKMFGWAALVLAAAAVGTGVQAEGDRPAAESSPTEKGPVNERLDALQQKLDRLTDALKDREERPPATPGPGRREGSRSSERGSAESRKTPAPDSDLPASAQVHQRIDRLERKVDDVLARLDRLEKSLGANGTPVRSVPPGTASRGLRRTTRSGDAGPMREGGDRPRAGGDGDRPRGDGDGDRPRGGGDGDRPRGGDGDRPRGDGDGERPRGDGDRPRAGGDGERGPGPEGQLRDP